jgi:hypothetical protein
MPTDKGLSVFMTKTAEAEPWLVQHAFVPPPEFEYFKGAHSNIIYARQGTGKTAVRCALEEYARSQLRCLPVRWTLDPDLQPLPPSTELANEQFKKILSACTHEILCGLTTDFKKQAKEDRNLDFLVEFLHRFAPLDDQEILTNLVPVAKSSLISDSTKLETIATDLIKRTNDIGFPGGIWIMMDGLDLNTETRRQSAVNILQSLLSRLSFFEITNFHFKMFLPIELEGELVETTAIAKERAAASRISWDANRLRVMIEKRLRHALGGEQIRADQVYPADQLFAWLEGCGGLSPRGWLEYFRPIFATLWEVYTSEGLQRLEKNEWILDEKEWVAARKRSSLRLRFYPESGQIAVGMNSAKSLSQEELAIFSYLHKEDRYCSKREIYNKAYLPFNTRGRGRELGPQDELKKEFEDLLNSAIHRLRKSIEPLPKDPVFLTMKKNQGYRLSLEAFRDYD